MTTPTSSSRRAARCGFTMVELVVVITIVAIVATLVTVSVGGVAASSRDDITKVAFTNIRSAIFGDHGKGYFNDVRKMPERIADLFRKPLDVPAYDPVTRVGWRGPYLSPQHGFYVVDVADDPNDPNDRYGFTEDYGVHVPVPDPVPLDAWQLPIVLQIPEADGVLGHSPDELRHARLVSAGENRGIDTPRTGATPLDAYFPPVVQCGDDLVFYLRVADERPRPVE